MKKLSGPRSLLIKQLKKVFQESIERLQTPAEADRFEFEIQRARVGHIISDSDALEMLQHINEIRHEKGWIQE